MSERALPALKFAGREFSFADLELIRKITTDFSVLGVAEIARTACELLEWKRPSGGLKNAECRRLIEHLAGQGLLGLPERRGAGAPGPRRAPRTELGEPPAEIHGSAGDFAPLRLEVVRGGPWYRGGNHALFKELLDRYHYMGYRAPFGASLRYLVRSRRAPEKVLACLLLSSPAWPGPPKTMCSMLHPRRIPQLSWVRQARQGARRPENQGRILRLAGRSLVHFQCGSKS
jgi:hypothetical protein